MLKLLGLRSPDLPPRLCLWTPLGKLPSPDPLTWRTTFKNAPPRLGYRMCFAKGSAVFGQPTPGRSNGYDPARVHWWLKDALYTQVLGTHYPCSRPVNPCSRPVNPCSRPVNPCSRRCHILNRFTVVCQISPWSLNGVGMGARRWSKFGQIFQFSSTDDMMKLGRHHSTVLFA